LLEGSGGLIIKAISASMARAIAAARAYPQGGAKMRCG